MSFLLLFLKSICGMILYKLKLLVISCENWCICDSLVSKITHTMDGPSLKRKTCLATKFTRVTHSLCAEVCCISCITSQYIWLQVKTFFFFCIGRSPNMFLMDYRNFIPPSGWSTYDQLEHCKPLRAVLLANPTWNPPNTCPVLHVHFISYFTYFSFCLDICSACIWETISFFLLFLYVLS